MRKNLIIQALLLIAALGAMVLVNYFTKEGGRIAYVDNQKLFNGYAGTKELEERLLAIQSQQQLVLDSLTSAIDAKVKQLQTSNNDQTLILDIERQKQIYSEKIEDFTAFFQIKEKEYTQQLWKQINQYVLDYGNSDSYEYIIGANGDGSLMYANSENDVTEKVLKYINQKYEDMEK